MHSGKFISIAKTLLNPKYVHQIIQEVCERRLRRTNKNGNIFAKQVMIIILYP